MSCTSKDRIKIGNRVNKCSENCRLFKNSSDITVRPIRGNLYLLFRIFLGLANSQVMRMIK
jgi:hypothetical protein